MPLGEVLKMNAVALVFFVVLVVAHASLSWVLVTRPESIIQTIAKIPIRGGRPVLDAISSAGPYRWLLSGTSASDFIEVARTQPSNFPRLILGIRMLGMLSLLVNLSIVAIMIVLTVV
jgi:hypothetical protein